MLLKDISKELSDNLNKEISGRKCLKGWTELNPIIREVTETFLKGKNSENLDINSLGGLLLSANNNAKIEVEVAIPVGFSKTARIEVACINSHIQWDKRCTTKAKCTVIDFEVITYKDFEDIDICDLKHYASNKEKKLLLENAENQKKILEKDLQNIIEDIEKIKNWIF